MRLHTQCSATELTATSSKAEFLGSLLMHQLHPVMPLSLWALPSLLELVGRRYQCSKLSSVLRRDKRPYRPA